MGTAEQTGRQHGGARVRNRDRKGLRLVRLIADVKPENLDRVAQIAAARGLSRAQCVDEMIEADWRRRERHAERAA